MPEKLRQSPISLSKSSTKSVEYIQLSTSHRSVVVPQSTSLVCRPRIDLKVMADRELANLLDLDLDLHLDGADGLGRREQEEDERRRQDWLHKFGFFLLCIFCSAVVLSLLGVGRVAGGKSVSPSLVMPVCNGEGEKRLLEDKITALEKALRAMTPDAHRRVQQEQQLKQMQEVEAKVAAFEQHQGALNSAIVQLGKELAALSSHSAQQVLHVGSVKMPPLNTSALNAVEDQVSHLEHRVNDLFQHGDAAREQQRVAELSTLLLAKTRSLRSSLELALKQATGQCVQPHAPVSPVSPVCSVCPVCPACPACPTVEASACPPSQECKESTTSSKPAPPADDSKRPGLEPSTCPQCESSASCQAARAKISTQLREALNKGAALRASEGEAQEKLEHCQSKLVALKESADIYNNAASDCLAELETAAEELNKKDAEAQLQKGSKEAERHLAERVNFASPAAGARVDRVNTSATFVPPSWQVGTVARDFLHSYGAGALSPFLPLAAVERHVLSLSDYLGLDRSTGVPEDALRADMSLGSCWPMAGQRGHFAVRLGQEVMVDRIALEHIGRYAPA